MKRIDIHYGGDRYSVGGRSFEDLKAEVEGLGDAGGWMLVNAGEGARRDAYLRITPGVAIAIIPVPDENPA